MSSPIDGKVCKSCGKLKLPTAFYRTAGWRCIDCHNQYSRHYRQTHKDYYREYMREYLPEYRKGNRRTQ